MSTPTLWLDVANDTAWARTLDALASAPAGPVVALTCARGCRLGKVATTVHGPLLVASWRVDDGPTRRALDAVAPVERTYGNPDTTEVHGTVALLALDDVPDLLVRCRHGDAVLSRPDVVDWLRKGRGPRIRTGYPLHAYATHHAAVGEAAGTREVRRIGSDAVPRSAFAAWWATDDTPNLGG